MMHYHLSYEQPIVTGPYGFWGCIRAQVEKPFVHALGDEVKGYVHQEELWPLVDLKREVASLTHQSKGRRGATKIFSPIFLQITQIL